MFPINKKKDIFNLVCINVQRIVFTKKKIFFLNLKLLLIIITGLTGVLEEMFPLHHCDDLEILDQVEHHQHISTLSW